jgi:eukaryotic-like serine/threonine-protein kinase
MADAAPPRIGNYEVTRELGRSAASTVYEGVEPAQGRSVTLAVAAEVAGNDESKVRAFWDEAMKLAELRHPNVARVLDRGRDGDHLYLVEEHVSGAPLDAVMRQRRLSIPEALMVFKALVSGLEAAHDRGIVHREITPAQVMVSEDLSVIKLRGFGMRHSAQTRGDGATVATTRTALSGLSYMSPEQAKNVAFADARSNLYSIGVIFYELLTGRVPRGKFQLPSQLNTEVPSQLDALVLKCVASRPEERYADIGELKRRFAAIEDQLRLGLLHELQGLQRSTAKVLRRQEVGQVSTAVDLHADAAVASSAPGSNKAVLWGIIAGAVLLAIVVAVFLLTR